MLRRFALACLMIVAAAAAFADRAPSSEELATLNRDAAAFARATEANDVGAMIDALPPRVIAGVAKDTGMSQDQVRGMLVDAARGFGATVKPQGVAADLGGLSLTDVKDRKAGGTLSWGLIHLKGSAKVGSNRKPFDAEMMALREGGRWYFSRIDATGQVGLIRKAYPELRGLPKSR